MVTSSDVDGGTAVVVVTVGITADVMDIPDNRSRDDVASSEGEDGTAVAVVTVAVDTFRDNALGIINDVMVLVPNTVCDDVTGNSSS